MTFYIFHSLEWWFLAPTNVVLHKRSIYAQLTRYGGDIKLWEILEDSANGILSLDKR